MLHTNKKNISKWEDFLSFLSSHSIKGSVIGQVIMYRRTYRNYIDVLLHSIRNQEYPLRATLRNGVDILLNNGLETYMIAQGGSNVCDYKEGVVTISIHSCGLDNPLKVRLYGVTIESEAFSIFANKIYRYLPVKGRTVIDIGANIADSSIYFSLLGANEVIALEPLPNTYEIAKKNIELNNLADNITLLLAGCAKERGSMMADPAANGRVTSRLSDNRVNSGIRYPC